MKKRITLSWLLMALICLPMFAQMQDPVRFKTEWKNLSANEAEIIFTGTMDQGWHVYSTDLQEGGPTSATFNIDKIEGAELVGKLTPIGIEIKQMDPIFEMEVKFFEGTAKFSQKVKLTGGDYLITGYLEFGACNDQNCLPPTSVDFSYKGTVAAAASATADFMASQLQKYGFSAQSLTSDTPQPQRKQLATDLRNGLVHYLCVVDIFNEGVDIPEVDTVLFLRPTDSLTIFLQQLGRGLRLSPGKTELTVLDFVAQAHKKYDFASKFRALTLRPEKNIAQQITNGFTLLPTGCSIIMEKQARQYILENIQQAIYNKTRLIKEINSYTTLPTLTQFLENNGQDIRVVYVGNNCWTSLKRAAGRISYTDDAITRRLEKGMGNMVHHNTASYLHFVADFLSGSKRYLDEDHLPYATMLYYNLYQERIDKTELKEMGMYQALALLHDNRYRYFKQEAAEIVSYLLSHLEITTTPLGLDVLPCIELYGYYTREEIFTLVGRQTEEKRMSGSVSGVFNLPEYDATLLFVTLNKSDKDFSPSTQYDDYVINKDYFHWQSKNTDSHYNRGGKIYTEQPQRHNKIVLFVREEKKDGFGNTCPFHCFGLVDYVSSYGDFPMNITWKLEKPVMAQYLKVV